MRVALTALAVVAATSILAQDGQDEREAQAMKRGRAATQQLYAAEAAALWEQLDEALSKLIGSEENLLAMCRQIEDQLGAERAVLAEEVVPVGAGLAYVRSARFEGLSAVIRVVCTFDEAWRLSGLNVAPVPKAAETEHLAYETKTELHLPFEGAWTVFWGGRELSENYHAAFVDQRFAYDLLIVKEGKSYTGEGVRNEDYFCFAQPVLAPGAGKVVSVVDGIEDNVPGEMNPAAAAGNHVVIEHGNGEFSMLAHFKKGTVEAREGDEVLAGDRLGLSGNSGNSSEPHIHYHLQTTPVWFQGEGLPSQFVDYMANGEPVERGEPVKGQAIENR